MDFKSGYASRFSVLLLLFTMLFAVLYALVAPVAESSSSLEIREINYPDYVVVGQVSEIVISISNRGWSDVEVYIELDITYGCLELAQVEQPLKIIIPAWYSTRVVIPVRGVCEGVETLHIKIMDLLEKHLYRTSITITVTQLRRIYIYAYAIFSVFSNEIGRRPVTLDLRICNVTASVLRENIHVAEIPRAFTSCTLEYRSPPFFKVQKRVYIESDSIYLYVFDTEPYVSIMWISYILLIPTWVIIVGVINPTLSLSSKVSSSCGATLLAVFLLAIVHLVYGPESLVIELILLIAEVIVIILKVLTIL